MFLVGRQVRNHVGNLTAGQLIGFHIFQPSAGERLHVLIVYSSREEDLKIPGPARAFPLWAVGGNRNHVGKLRPPYVVIELVDLRIAAFERSIVIHCTGKHDAGKTCIFPVCKPRYLHIAEPMEGKMRFKGLLAGTCRDKVVRLILIRPHDVIDVVALVIQHLRVFQPDHGTRFFLHGHAHHPGKDLTKIHNFLIPGCRNDLNTRQFLTSLYRATDLCMETSGIIGSDHRLVPVRIIVTNRVKTCFPVSIAHVHLLTDKDICITGNTIVVPFEALIGDDGLMTAILIVLLDILPESGQPDRYNRSDYYKNNRGVGDFAPSFAESYQTEQAILHFIDTGNIKELRQLSANPDLPMPDIGNTPMSQQKIACIVGVTVISRHVIRKGMDVNMAMRLSDLYLKAIDSAGNTKDLALLMNNAYTDYSERLRALRIPEAISPVVYQCIQYVQQMVNTPLAVTDVANHVEKSPTYLSAKFKREMGCTLNAFITKCKIDEARSLLQHTEMSIADISSYLCFSDQCYFHRVFRKVTGKTPLQYRNESLSEYKKFT